MAKWYIAQTNFLAGELAPDYAAQLDTEYVRSGLSLALNALLNQSGAINKSPGSSFAADAGEFFGVPVPRTFRLWSFLAPDNTWAVAFFRDDKVSVTTQLSAARPPANVQLNLSSGIGWVNVLANDKFETVALLQTPAPNYGNAVSWAPATPTSVRDTAPSARDYPVTVTSHSYAVNPGLADANGGQRYGTKGGVMLYHHVAPDDTTPRSLAAQKEWFVIPDLTGLGEQGTRVLQTVNAPRDVDGISAKITFSIPDWSTPPASPAANKLFSEFDTSLLALRVRVTTEANVDAGAALLDEVVSIPPTATRGQDIVSPLLSVDSLVGVPAGTPLVVSVSLVTTGLDAFMQSTTVLEKTARGFLAALQLKQVTVYLSGVAPPLMADTVIGPYTAEQLDALHFVQSPFDDKELLVFHPDVPPQKLYKHPVGGDWRIEAYVFTDAPTEWGPQYPATAVGYQGRLVMTGHPEHSETVWASKSNQWRVFTTPSVNPDDPVIFTPTARGVNTWLSATRRLLFGSTTGEYSVDTSSGLLQPSDVAVNTQTSHGHLASVQPINVGSDVLLTTSGDKAVRLLKYTESSGGFEAKDVGNHARHLMKRRVKRAVFVRDPAESLWLVMHDGTVLVANKEPDSATPGYTQLYFSGDVKDLCVVYTPEGATNVVMVVERVDPLGVSQYHLEVIPDIRNTDGWGYTNATTTVVKVDSAATEVAGFEHFEGRTVLVSEDGVYTGRQVVVDGKVQVTNTTAAVSAGLGYTFKVVTFPTAVYDARLGGIDAVKRYVEVGVRVSNSGPPTLNGQQLPDRRPADLMGANPQYEGIKEYTTTGRGLSTFDGITVEDSEPFAFALLGIFAKISANDA